MANKIFLIIILTLVLTSCNRQPTSTSDCTPKTTVNNFRGYSWGTDVSKIIADLGEPRLKQTFQQYGTQVVYFHIGHVIEYGYDAIYNFAFINNKLVGGGYWITKPSDDNTKHINNVEDMYIDLKEKLTGLYNEPDIQPELYAAALDTALKRLNMEPTIAQRDELLNMMRNAGQRDLPENTRHSSEDKFNALLPFQNIWNNNGTEIKLSLDFDEYYIVKIDFISPEIIRLTLPELAKTIITLYNDPNF